MSPALGTIVTSMKSATGSFASLARHTGRLVISLAVALTTISCGGSGGGDGSEAALASAAAEAASAQLASLVDEVWNRSIERAPFLRVNEGLPLTEIPELDYARAEDDAAYAQSVVDRIEAIDLGALPHDDLLTAQILRWQSSMTVEGLQYYWLNSFQTPYRNPLPRMRLLFVPQLLEDLQDLENYLSLVEQVMGFVRSMHETAYGQAERGYVLSAANLPAVVALTRSMIRPPDEHWLAPAADKLAVFETENAEAFELQFADLVALMNNALESYADYLEGEYADQAPAGVGVKQYPNGEAYYRYLTRLHTTMDVTPEEVQEVGFQMVQEMQASMAEIQTEIGYDGTGAEFREHLRNEPSFYPQSPDEVAERLMAASNAFFERVDEFFIEVPEAPFGVRRLDPSLEGTQTYGYYSIPTPTDPMGYYNYNGSRLNERSWLNVAALSFHELFPGHHYQISRQMENDALPPLRRNSRQTAYTEGWGSYSSYLGRDAGMFEDPYSHYGLYILEIFLGTRLVVDPGMNYFDWSLEQGRDFMRESTFESETQIATESLRYSTDMPGQALAYQMGKRKFLELRARAEAELGDDFDIRRFHEAIIGSGSMPMDVLDEHIDWFIEQEKARVAGR